MYGFKIWLFLLETTLVNHAVFTFSPFFSFIETAVTMLFLMCSIKKVGLEVLHGRNIPDSSNTYCLVNWHVHICTYLYTYDSKIVLLCVPPSCVFSLCSALLSAGCDAITKTGSLMAHLSPAAGSLWSAVSTQSCQTPPACSFRSLGSEVGWTQASRQGASSSVRGSTCSSSSSAAGEGSESTWRRTRASLGPPAGLRAARHSCCCWQTLWWCLQRLLGSEVTNISFSAPL